MPRLPETLLARLLDADGWNHLAIGAERDGDADDAIVGVARYFRVADEPDTAEVAVAVVDELHGLGLGRMLLVALVDEARERGIEKFRAQVLAGNERMKAILQDSGATAVSRPGQGYIAYEVRLPKAKRYVFRRERFYHAFKLVAERIGTATTEGLSAALRGALGLGHDSNPEAPS